MTKHNLKDKKFTIKQENGEDLQIDDFPKDMIVGFGPDEFFPNGITVVKGEVVFHEAEQQAGSVNLEAMFKLDKNSQKLLRLYQKQSTVEEFLEIVNDEVQEEFEEPELGELFVNTKQVLAALNHIFKLLEYRNITVDENGGIKFN